MRTKTTILSAVALAAGLAYASAQVYSANVVGYYNVTVPAHGRHFLANQLTNAGDINIDLANGPVSDPNGILNTSYNLYDNNAHNYVIYQYWLGVDADNNFGNGNQGNGWYDGGGFIHHTPFPSGLGAFIINPQSTNITMTLVGQVIQGTYSTQVKPGYNAFSLTPAVSTNISSFAQFPGYSDPNGIQNDTYNLWDDSIQNYRILSYWIGSQADDNYGNGNQGDGWYDGGGFRQDLTNPVFNAKVGGAFFIIRPSTGTSNWVYSFTVQ